MNQQEINDILRDLESGYDQMAEKFSQTRNFFWRDLAFIADYVEDGDKVFDFGCGNGRLLEILKDKKIDYTGVDISQKLLDLAKSRYPEHNFQKLTGQDRLSFNGENFNKIISIAVFHHFPQDYAQKIVKELYRITKPGGKVIVTAWNLWQPKYRKYILSPKILLNKLVKNRELGFKDVCIPFKNNEGKIFDRYHRAYTKGDLAKIFSEAGFKVDKCFISSGKNIVLIASKM